MNLRFLCSATKLADADDEINQMSFTKSKLTYVGDIAVICQTVALEHILSNLSLEEKFSF